MADTVRHLVIVLGDQLDPQSSALQGFDSAQDVVWMAEVAEESTQVWSAKQRIAVFLSAMRHFAQELQAQGVPLRYTRLDDSDNTGNIETVTMLSRGKTGALLFRYDNFRSRSFIFGSNVRTGIINSAYAKLEPIQHALFDWEVSKVRKTLPPGFCASRYAGSSFCSARSLSRGRRRWCGFAPARRSARSAGTTSRCSSPTPWARGSRATRT